MSLWQKDKAAPGIEDRLGELEAEVRTLKTANKHLELEWEELYDKVRRQMSRMSKRSAVDAPPLINDTPAPDPDNGVDPISAAIHARRNMSRPQA